MLERVVSPDQFAELDRRSRLNNGSTAVPMRINGNSIPSLAAYFIRQKEEYHGVENIVLNSAMQSLAISIGNGGLYEEFQNEHPQSVIPEIPQFNFASELTSLPSQNQIEQSLLRLTPEEILSEIEKNRSLFEGNTEDSPAIYSPYFFNDVSAAQTDITTEIRKINQQLKEEIEGLKSGKGSISLQLQDPKIVTAINPVTRTHLLPTSVPFNTKEGDFDSGDCDKGLATSLARGDRVAAVATFGDQTFVIGNGVNGWVKNSDITTIGNDVSKALEDYQIMYYAGDRPHFYTTHDGKESVILPGDVVYRDVDTTFVLDGDQVHGVSASAVNEIDLLLTDGIKSPQEFVDFVYSLKTPYMWANFDCAEIIRRALRMTGIPIKKYSQDMMDDLLVLGEQPSITDASELDTLQDGLYITHLLVPTAEGLNPRHLYLDLVMEGKHYVFSQAFQIVNDLGTIDTPVGPHFCGKEGLAEQLRRGRQLTFARIAA